MSFKSFQLKVNPRANVKPVTKEREYLPNGFYVGQRIYFFDQFENRNFYGNVIKINNNNSSTANHKNNTTNVWAIWEDSGNEDFMPKNRCIPA